MGHILATDYNFLKEAFCSLCFRKLLPQGPLTSPEFHVRFDQCFLWKNTLYNPENLEAEGGHQVSVDQWGFL